MQARRFFVALTAPVLLATPLVRPLVAQTAAEHVATGDKEYEANRSAAALKHYEAAIAQNPKDYVALYKAARSEVDLGEVATEKDERTQHFKNGEALARRAVEANPGDAEGHFHLARALGRAALSLGPRDRVKYGSAVHDEALAALKINARHPGALHVMGMWNAEIMRLNGVTRFFAKNVLGGKVFNEANWDNAVKYLEQAVAVEPTRIVHRLDLAQIYADVNQKAKAREQYETLLKLPNQEPNDPKYKSEASELVKKL